VEVAKRAETPGLDWSRAISVGALGRDCSRTVRSKALKSG
jgi:hypothetical protein